MSETTATELPSWAEPEKNRCEDCGEVSHSLDGFQVSYSHGSRYQGHGTEDRCERAKGIDYGLAFDLLYQRVCEMQRAAWLAFTEDLDDDEWEALPEKTRSALTGLWNDATEALAWRTYEACLSTAPNAKGHHPERSSDARMD